MVTNKKAAQRLCSFLGLQSIGCEQPIPPSVFGCSQPKTLGAVNLLGFIGGFFDRKLPKPGKQNDQNTANDVEP